MDERVSNAFIDAEVLYFKQDRIQDAWDWLRGADAKTMKIKVAW